MPGSTSSKPNRAVERPGDPRTSATPATRSMVAPSPRLRRYALAQRTFASRAALRLPKAARDELRELCPVVGGIVDVGETSVDGGERVLDLDAWIRRRRPKIRAWARRWQVDTHGMREWAVAQIHTWTDLSRGLIVVFAYTHQDARWTEPNPEYESRKEYLERITDWARERWDTIPRSDAHEFRSSDFISQKYQVREMPDGRPFFFPPLGPIPEPTSTSTGSGVTPPLLPIHHHCEWLARYQVGHESFGAIARSVDKERQSVTEAIKAAARMLNISLRPPNVGGRPKS